MIFPVMHSTSVVEIGISDILRHCAGYILKILISILKLVG